MSTNYESVRKAVLRTRELVNTARQLDNVEMYLVLRSDVVTAMTCSYGQVLSQARSKQARYNSQMEHELGRIVRALAVLEQNRAMPARLDDASADWAEGRRHVAMLAERVERIERSDDGWEGRAREQKTAAVKRQLAATQDYAVALAKLSESTVAGRKLMDAIFASGAMTMTGCNARLGGFVGRSPSVWVGVWGLFSRSSAAVYHLRAAADAMTRLVSSNAWWRPKAGSLGGDIARATAGSSALPSNGWPTPSA